MIRWKRRKAIKPKRANLGARMALNKLIQAQKILNRLIKEYDEVLRNAVFSDPFPF